MLLCLNFSIAIYAIRICKVYDYNHTCNLQEKVHITHLSFTKVNGMKDWFRFNTLEMNTANISMQNLQRHESHAYLDVMQ